jgi:hypothetical protein
MSPERERVEQLTCPILLRRRRIQQQIQDNNVA